MPPQQKDWWGEKLWETRALGSIPREVHEFIVDEVDGFPMTMEQAKAWRLELMEERKTFVKEHNDGFEGDEFALCEH